ncbi:MAG: pyruvate formate lyase family protein [Thermodesulfobacteriota bacterium]|nr:pyruvate formate lyase family protein [Thermodesulfobacteriota bacterium]
MSKESEKASKSNNEKSVKELEKNREWWWVAEKKRSKRLGYLRKAVWKKGRKGGMYEPGIKIDLERPALFTESWKENEGDPIIMKRAKAFAHVLDNIPIFITDHAQIVGYLGSLPNTIYWYCELASLINDEIYNDPVIIPEPHENSLKIMADINNYWVSRDNIGKVIRDMSPEEAVKIMTMVILWGIPIGGSFAYSGKDYEYFMTGERAFEDILNEIQERIDEAEEKIAGNPGPDIIPLYDKLLNWEAIEITLLACIRMAKRYARLARIIAENFESNPERRKELLRISQTCEQVPAKPPRSFQESLQYDHFIQIWSRFEDWEGAWPSRPDYYHWPYYNRDVNIEKSITKEEALDLIGEFMIRCCETGYYLVRGGAEGIQGIPGTYVWTLGGVNQDGSDACNDLTVAFLQAARLIRVANPTFGFRWHPKVNDEVMREIFECIRQGLGYPSIRHDPVLIANGMYWHNHPLKEMRTWVHQACMSPAPTTKHGFQPCRMASATLNCSKMIEYTLHDGFDHIINMQMGPNTGNAKKFTDFEHLFEAWVKQMEWLMNFGARMVNRGRVKSPVNFGRPFLSAISERSIESGLDIIEPSGERGNAWTTFFTWVENVDSLSAIKKLVFDEKKYTMEELIEALKNNWEGKEEMRLDFVKNAPKWGNDDDYVDELMVRCLREVSRHSLEIRCPSGNPWPALPENVSGNIHFSNLVHALPNGRKLGDALYDGGISPGPGLDKKGPTAILKSCSKIDHVTHGRAFLLNQRLSPTQLQGEKGYQLWKAYMRTWADLELDHVQFNMIDDATLRAAQKDPEQYQEVIVRVAGYSAHFVDISRKTQDNIIQRTIQGLG